MTVSSAGGICRWSWKVHTIYTFLYIVSYIYVNARQVHFARAVDHEESILISVNQFERTTAHSAEYHRPSLRPAEVVAFHRFA